MQGYSLFKGLPDDAGEKLKQSEQPEWVEPMLATLTDDCFSDEKWIFERKLDGQRCLVFGNGDRVRLLSRNQKELNVAYPELVDAFGRQDVTHFIVDGEIVAFAGKVTSFSQLQDRMHVSDPEEARRSEVAVYYYAFDLLYLEGYDTTKLELRQRKSLLKRALTYADPLRFLSHRNTEGEAYLEEACRRGWEGLIAKRADYPYVHGRSRQWLKFKCVNQQEFVVGGYTEPMGKRIELGALLLGYYKGDDLIYAGKVGTGFDDEALRRLGQRLSSLARETPPFAKDQDLETKDVHWVEPELVAEVGFTEWTDDGKLRHPRYLGLRQDKDAREVVRERP